jgi:hypothetical protein
MDAHGLLLAVEDQDVSPAQYIDLMSRDGQWAGMFELLGCVRYLRVPITVVTGENIRTYAVGPTGEMVEHDGWGDLETGVVAYNGDSHFYGTMPLEPVASAITTTGYLVRRTTTTTITTTTTSTTADYHLTITTTTITASRSSSSSGSSSSSVSSSGRSSSRSSTRSCCVKLPKYQLLAEILSKPLSNVDELIKV